MNPAPETFTVNVETSPAGARILKLKGPLTIRTLFDFQTVSRQAVTQPVIVDLTNVPYVDSAGLGCIVSVFTSCQNRKLAFAVCGLTHRLQTLFEVTHVSSLLPAFDTFAAAEAYISQGSK